MPPMSSSSTFIINLMWKILVYVTYHACLLTDVGNFSPNEVLLDNQNNVSIMKPGMLIDVQHAVKHVHILGAGRMQFAAYDIGCLQYFFPVYTSDSTQMNI